MKRIIIVHGFKGKPKSNWKPWLKNELESSGFTVSIPEMPNTEHPDASEWNSTLAQAVGVPDKEMYLIGHSLGCITILRYLETLSKGQRIGGAIFIAGFGEQFQKYEQGWHDTFFDHQIDWRLIRSHCTNFIAIHSEDDPNVEPAQLELFKKQTWRKTNSRSRYGSFWFTRWYF